MSVHDKRKELIRLQKSFEKEAARFHDLTLSIFYLTQGPPASNRTFASDNHFIPLWQYYGHIGGEDDVTELMSDIASSNLELAGLRGSQFSCCAVIEGPRVRHFVKMAKRAGNLFSKHEAIEISKQAQADFDTNVPQGKPLFTMNSNPLAVWLNFILHHIGKTHPRYLPETTVNVDPFAASLSAIDQLLESGSLNSQSMQSTGIEDMQFRVALSFPGERREYVEQVASSLRDGLGDDAVFYDNFYQPYLARPNLDLLLQKIYREKADLIVVFLCSNYADKEWCGLEWRAIRDLIKECNDDRLMFFRFDDAPISGLFGIDGFIDIGERSPQDAAHSVLVRLGLKKSG